MKRILLFFAAIISYAQVVSAQRETANWRFGVQAGLRFPVTGIPTAVSGSALTSPGREGCSVVSDSLGNLLCYTNAAQVWDRNNAPMPNGTLVHSNVSATQSALLVPDPGNVQQHYLFTVDAVENNLAGGLRYSLVDMRLRSGLGDIGLVKEVPVSIPGNAPIAEKLTAIRHTNGRDFWIVIHAYGSNAFYSYLLTATGLNGTPVVSNQGRAHIGGAGTYGNGNAVGYIRASPNGQRLAVAIREVALEVFDFNPATGQVSNTQSVSMSAPYYYGAEFSPDGRKLYVSDLTGNTIRQVDLQVLPLTAQVVGTVGNYTGAILRGPDGILYVAVELSNYLATITNPNGTAATCGLVTNGVFLGTGQGRQGLPNFPNSFAPAPVQALTLTVPQTTCAGETVTVSSPASAVPAGSTFTWNFGDPTSGTTNTATGPNANHRYQSAGSYTISLTVTTPTGILTVQRSLIVNAPPLVNLAPRLRQLCAGQSVSLSSPTTPTGTTYRWSDGSAGTTFTATAPGWYVLEVTSPQGCRARDSVEVRALPVPTVSLGPDLALCPAAFPVQLSVGTQPAGTTFRWQDGSTGPAFAAVGAGSYSVVVTSAQGCQASATVTVQRLPVPTVSLGPNRVVCADSFPVSLRANAQPVGSTFRWTDGSTAATYAAPTPGIYTLEVRSAQGCTAQATVEITTIPCLPVLIPNIITPNGDAANQTFVLQGLNAADWSLRLYNRWGREVYHQQQYDNTWAAQNQPSGIYYYLLTNAQTGQHYKGWVEVVR